MLADLRDWHSARIVWLDMKSHLEQENDDGQETLRREKNLVLDIFLLGLTETTVAAVQVALVGVDDTVAATHRFILFRAKTWTRASFPDGLDTTYVLTHIP